jgi:hypothetical protein
MGREGTHKGWMEDNRITKLLSEINSMEEED